MYVTWEEPGGASVIGPGPLCRCMIEARKEGRKGRKKKG